MSSSAPSVDIKDIIEDSSAGLGLTFGTDLFISEMPSNPDDCVAVYDSGGAEQGQFNLENPNVQIIVRNGDYQTGYALCRDIKNELHDNHNNETVNSTRYLRIYCRADILYLGKDEHNRYKWSINFRVMRSGN